MYRRLMTSCLVILFTCKSFAQSKDKINNSILIYSDDNGYMQPYIENTIKNLKNTETDSLYFNSVNSFNRFIIDNKYQAQLNDLLLTQKSSNVRLATNYSESEKKIRERIFNVLKKYNYFLTVKTNTLGELIEFQFQLFETVSSDYNTFNISDRVLGVENFFINPKEKDYTTQITNAIQRLFIKSNKIPEAELKVLEKTFISSNETNKIILPINTKIVFDGSNSGDYDSESINYLWRNISNKNEKYQTIKKIEFIENSSKQEIIIQEKGSYKIGFKVFDGINYSKEIILDIVVKNKPDIIEIYNEVTYSNTYKSFISAFKRKKEKNYSAKIFVKNEIDNDSILKKIIITREAIDQRKLDGIDDKILVKDVKVQNYLLGAIKFIDFKSDFNNLSHRDQKTYYMYNVDIDGNLYNEKIIKHYHSERNPVNFKLRYNVGLIDFQIDDEIDSDGIENNYALIELGVFISDNFELTFSTPLAKVNEINYNSYIFRYPHNFATSLNYHFVEQNKQTIGAFSPYLGCIIKGYVYEKSSIVNNSNYTYSWGAKGGVVYMLSTKKYYDVSFVVDLNHDVFLNSKFKEIKATNFSFGTIVKF